MSKQVWNYKFDGWSNEIKPSKEYISGDWENEFRNKKVELAAAERKTQSQLSKLLQDIRSGQANKSEMETLLETTLIVTIHVH